MLINYVRINYVPQHSLILDSYLDKIISHFVNEKKRLWKKECYPIHA